MSEKGIDTRLVYGFLDAGKTTYIQDCIQSDYFYKYGSTLILCFEEGERAFDTDALTERRTAVAYYDGTEEVATFCESRIKAYHPDRIYVEMNTMMEGLRNQLPASLRVTYAITWIDWTTLKLFFINFRQMMGRMIADSHQVIFRGCPSKELLSPYSQDFRLMNQKASYLRQDPMGYHEKAFDLFLPFSLEDEEISVTEERYLPLWLDAFDHPEHYEGKRLRFTDPLELRQNGTEGHWSAGRVVMTCCMADLQFMAFEITEAAELTEEGWVSFDSLARTETDAYGRRSMKLKPVSIRYASAPKNRIMNSRQPPSSGDEE